MYIQTINGFSVFHQETIIFQRLAIRIFLKTYQYLYEMPLKYLLLIVNSYSRSISLRCYSSSLLNIFLSPCISVSNSAWFELRHISCWHTRMTMSLIPVVLSPLLIAKRQECDPQHFFSCMCTKIIDLICQKISEHRIT